MSAKAGSNLNTVSMIPTLEENIKNVESKITGIPSVSAKAGSNLNSVSLTQTRNNNTGGESKIKGVPSVSVKADSNLNTVSMTPSLELKNTKRFPCNNLKKKVREKYRECHNHKPQPFPDTKRKRKPTNPNKHKSNKRTKSTKISSLSSPSEVIAKGLKKD